MKIKVDQNSMPPIQLAEAKCLKVGDILYHRRDRNADGSARRWRVNGRPKTWKRDQDRVRVPLKHGLYSYDYLDENTLSLLSLENGEVEEEDKNGRE
jgi:hypothetical protein